MLNLTTNELNEPNTNPTSPNTTNTPICLDRPIPTTDVTKLTNSSFTIEQLHNMIPPEVELTSREDIPFPTSLPPILSPYPPSNLEESVNMWSFIVLKNGLGLYVYLYSLSNSGLSGFLIYPPTIFISIFILMEMVSQINFF
jgi:hypothetical protein